MRLRDDAAEVKEVDVLAIGCGLGKHDRMDFNAHILDDPKAYVERVDIFWRVCLHHNNDQVG